MANKNPMSLPMMRAMVKIVKTVKGMYSGALMNLKDEGVKGVHPADITKVRNMGNFRGSFHNHKSRTFKRNRRAELKRRKRR